MKPFQNFYFLDVFDLQINQNTVQPSGVQWSADKFSSTYDAISETLAVCKRIAFIEIVDFKSISFWKKTWFFEMWDSQKPENLLEFGHYDNHHKTWGVGHLRTRTEEPRSPNTK